MESTTRATIRNRVLVKLGQVSGSAVQKYTEPVLNDLIQEMIDMLLNQHKWPQYWAWSSITLDGTTGVATSMPSGLKRFMDVDKLYISGTDYEIMRPIEREHLLLTGADARYVTPIVVSADDYASLLRFYPLTATSTIDMHWMARPDKVDTDSTAIYLDETLLVCYVTWSALARSGINPGHAELELAKAKEQMENLLTMEANIALGQGRGHRYDSFTVTTI